MVLSDSMMQSGYVTAGRVSAGPLSLSLSTWVPTPGSRLGSLRRDVVGAAGVEGTWPGENPRTGSQVTCVELS